MCFVEYRACCVFVRDVRIVVGVNELYTVSCGICLSGDGCGAVGVWAWNVLGSGVVGMHKLSDRIGM